MFKGLALQFELDAAHCMTCGVHRLVSDNFMRIAALASPVEPAWSSQIC